MKTILINPAEIECCWEKNDACFIKTKSGKVWVCNKFIYSYNMDTKSFISAFRNEAFIELPLQERGDNNG